MRHLKIIMLSIMGGVICVISSQFCTAAVLSQSSAQIYQSVKSSGGKNNASINDNLLDRLSNVLQQKTDLKINSDETLKNKANSLSDQKKEPSNVLKKEDQQDRLAVERERINQLKNIKKQMLSAKNLLGQQKSGQKTQEIQADVIADLDNLIKNIRQQTSKSSKITSAKKNQSKSSSDQKTKETDDGMPTNAASQNSNVKSKNPISGRVKAGNRKSLLKEYWGHLPLHLRQRMPQNPNGQFLPKYELEIEEYFRRLLELQ